METKTIIGISFGVTLALLTFYSAGAALVAVTTFCAAYKQPLLIAGGIFIACAPFFREDDGRRQSIVGALIADWRGHRS